MLDAQLDRLAHDHSVALRVRALADLVEQPDSDPWRPDLSTGTDDALSVLTAARHLPDRLLLQVLVETGDPDAAEVAQVSAGVRARAQSQAASAWRAAAAVRNEGLRQMPVSLTVAVVAASVAGALAYVAGNAASSVVGVVLAVLAGLSMTIAWVTSWMVMEYALYDWRDAGRRARAYELLASSELQVTPCAASTVAHAATATSAG